MGLGSPSSGCTSGVMTGPILGCHTLQKVFKYHLKVGSEEDPGLMCHHRVAPLTSIYPLHLYLGCHSEAVQRPGRFI